MATASLLRAWIPLVLCTVTPAFASGSYHVDQVVPLGGDGGWDYVTVDSDYGRVFLPRGKYTQVIDAASNQVLATIPGQHHNHGVAIAPAIGRGFITDSEDACVYIFDLASYQVMGKVKAADDADGAIYDPQSDKVFVACGDAAAVIPISPSVDPVHGSPDPAIDLGGKPEFLAVDGRGHLFVNLVDKNLVAVVDTKAMKVVAKWPTAPGGSPVGMAVDPAGHHLFVGCRKPQLLLVMNSDTGRVEASLPIGAGVDATAFDNGSAFASCRDGTLIVAQASQGSWVVAQTVQTRPGARTLGADHRTHSLFLPTAEFMPKSSGGRPTAKPGSFMLVVVKP